MASHRGITLWRDVCCWQCGRVKKVTREKGSAWKRWRVKKSACPFGSPWYGTPCQDAKPKRNPHPPVAVTTATRQRHCLWHRPRTPPPLLPAYVMLYLPRRLSSDHHNNHDNKTSRSAAAARFDEGEGVWQRDIVTTIQRHHPSPSRRVAHRCCLSREFSRELSVAISDTHNRWAMWLPQRSRFQQYHTASPTWRGLATPTWCLKSSPGSSRLSAAAWQYFLWEAKRRWCPTRQAHRHCSSRYSSWPWWLHRRSLPLFQMANKFDFLAMGVIPCIFFSTFLGLIERTFGYSTINCMCNVWLVRNHCCSNYW